MSTGTYSQRVALLALGLALTAASGVLGQDPPKDKLCPDPVLGIIEGPDPVTGRCVCESASSPAGLATADLPGRGPTSARDPRSGRAVAVWAAPAGGDHDIALGEWDEGEPASVIYLTSRLTDDLDPRAAFDAMGGLHVAWWSRGERDEVVYAHRDPTSGGWWPDRTVAIDARNPALAIVDGVAWLAFVRDGASGSEIVLGVAGAAGEIDLSVAARIAERPVDGLRLGVTAGRPQIDWTESDGRVVRVERWGTAWVRYDVGLATR